MPAIHRPVATPVTSATTGTYVYYIIPKTNVGNVFFNIDNSSATNFDFELDNIKIDLIAGATQPLYTAVLNNVTDYYAFGAPMPGRNYTNTGYRYGMNGQEKDDEIANGIYGALFWEYDSRLGRRWNLDPMPTADFSQYGCFLDDPIGLSDPNGDIVDPDDKATAKFLRMAKRNNASIRAELNAQEVHQRSSILVRKDGKVVVRKAIDQHYHYKVNKNSNVTFQQAMEIQQNRRNAQGSSPNANHYYVSFNIFKTEAIHSFGSGYDGTRWDQTIGNTPERKITTEDTYRDYNINLKFHPNVKDADNDRVRIYHGSNLIYGSSTDKNFSNKDADGYSTITLSNGTGNTNGSRAKITIRITNDDGKSDSKPGAHVLKGTVSGF